MKMSIAKALDTKRGRTSAVAASTATQNPPRLMSPCIIDSILRTGRSAAAQASAAASGTPRSSRRMELMMHGLISRGGFWVAVLAATALVLPLLVSSAFAIDIFIRVLLFAFVGVAWNLVGGYAKQLSLGHAAYFGLGAYTSTILL